jgi:hypothetical protein
MTAKRQMQFKFIDESSGPPARKPSTTAWAGVLIFISLFVLFRPFFASHFDLTLGDPGDGRFELAILEHWTKVFHGQAAIGSPNFFYPEKGVLGYSDAFLGLGLLHAFFRLLGADRYLAVELATMLFVALGFVAMYHLMRKVLHFTRAGSLVGATLFVISDMYYVYVVHPYILVSVMTAPMVFLLAGKYWQQRNVKAAGALLYLCLSSVLLALIFYTSFYIGWFLLLCSAVVALVYVGCCIFAERSASPLSRGVKYGWQHKWDFILAGIVFLLSMAPFMVLYMPSLHRTGKRSIAETLGLMPGPLAIVDVGRENLVWGRMSGRIEDWLVQSGGAHEHPTGWPLLTILVFLVAAVYCGVQLVRVRRGRIVPPPRRLFLMSAIVLTCLTLWTAGVRVGAHAPVWLLLTKVVPGAAAIRIPQRIDLVLNIGVVVVCMFGLEALRKKLAPFGALAYLVPAFLVGAMAIEQLNMMETHLISRKGEAQKFARVSPPPKACSSFFVSDWSSTNIGMVHNQTDAMMVAQQYDIPTVNGTSSWFPTGWDFLEESRAHVASTAMDWAKQKGVANGLCALDVSSGIWKPAAEEEQEEASAHFSQPVPGKITNPGFEDSDMNAWDLFKYVRATMANSPVHSGLHSAAESEAEGSVYQDVPGLQIGQQYRISAWVSASPGATAGAYLAVFEFGASVPIFSETVHPDANWQLLSDTINIKYGGTVRIHLYRTEGLGTIYWDDVNIQVESKSDSKRTAN